MRTIRVLRPLKFVSSFFNLSLLVSALFESASGILNFFLLLVSIWLIYGILGIILFRDRFGYCQFKLNFNVGKDSVFIINILFFIDNKCPEKDWIVHPFNFDNISNAFLTLFTLSTIDGWSETMNIGVNSDLATNVTIFKTNIKI